MHRRRALPFRDFIFSLLLMSQSAQSAAPNCQTIYSRQSVRALSTWEKLPTTFDTAWTAEFVTKLDQHPLTQKLRKKYGDGEGIEFSGQFLSLQVRPI